MPAPRLILVMGVACTGKSTLASALADALARRFIEADDHHPGANIAKMRAGTPLSDEDRRPWLDALRAAVSAELEAGRSVVLACSALKAAYRAHLLPPDHPALVVHLTAPRKHIADHLRRRAELGTHFMPPALLDSQLATLEPPTGREPGIHRVLTLPAYADPPRQIEQVRAALAERFAGPRDTVR